MKEGIIYVASSIKEAAYAMPGEFPSQCIIRRNRSKLLFKAYRESNAAWDPPFFSQRFTLKVVENSGES